MRIRAIRSGGQTGADRGALDAARAAGVAICGWCPKGGWAEDMPEAPGLRAAYPELKETPSPHPAQRTEWNVRDSDATLIVCDGEIAQSSGTYATIEFAKHLGKPYFVSDGTDYERVRAWLEALADGHAIDLNVAGPRESGLPGTFGSAKRLIGMLLEDADTCTLSRGEHPLRLHVLASGSKGNCSVVENLSTGGCLVIDCGISRRAFLERLAACGLDAGSIEAILVTHEHSDHTKGLGVLTRALAKCGVHPALYASAAVHEASSDLQAIQDAVDLRHFMRGDNLILAGMTVHAFATSHDAAESFGFRFDAEGDSIGFMTDTGVVTGEAHESLQACRILAIEANHDLDMLEHGPYPYYLKKRIASERGHLSNTQSADELELLLSNRVEQIVGMHVSQNNNTYALPRKALADALVRNDHPAHVSVAYQDRPISL